MHASKNLITLFLGAVLAVSPALTSATLIDRDGSSESTADITAYTSTDCSGGGQQYKAKGTQEVSLDRNLCVHLALDENKDTKKQDLLPQAHIALSLCLVLICAHPLLGLLRFYQWWHASYPVTEQVSNPSLTHSIPSSEVWY